MTRGDDEFFEDDEPIEKIRSAFDRGERGVTRQPPIDATSVRVVIEAGVIEEADYGPFSVVDGVDSVTVR